MKTERTNVAKEIEEQTKTKNLNWRHFGIIVQFCFVGCILWLRNGPECFTAMLEIFAILWKALEIVGRRCVWMWVYARMFHAILYRLKRNLECLHPYITKHCTTADTYTLYIHQRAIIFILFEYALHYSFTFLAIPTRNGFLFFNGNRIVLFKQIENFFPISTHTFICQTFKSIVFSFHYLFLLLLYKPLQHHMKSAA